MDLAEVEAATGSHPAVAAAAARAWPTATGERLKGRQELSLIKVQVKRPSTLYVCCWNMGVHTSARIE